MLKPTIEGNREAHSWLRGEQSVFVPEENRERNIKVIDFEKPENNLYHVTDEWWQKGVVFSNRADVVFLINGIPVALAELKNATKQDGMSLGVDQIRRYHRETPEMFVATQVFEVTQLLDFFYGVTWSTSRKNLFNWRDEQPGNYESKVKAFFNRPRFLRLVRDYVIFMTENDELTKKILRQHQTRAVEKVIAASCRAGEAAWTHLAHAGQRQDPDHADGRGQAAARDPWRREAHGADAHRPQRTRRAASEEH